MPGGVIAAFAGRRGSGQVRLRIGGSRSGRPRPGLSVMAGLAGAQGDDVGRQAEFSSWASGCDGALRPPLFIIHIIAAIIAA